MDCSTASVHRVCVLYHYSKLEGQVEVETIAGETAVAAGLLPGCHDSMRPSAGQATHLTIRFRQPYANMQSDFSIT